MTEIILNQGQQAAADAFFDFLMTDENTFGISGSAGTGKTFLMGYLSDKVMPLYHKACAMVDEKPEFNQVLFTATTNKAAEVLEHSLNKPVRTIHSTIGLKVKQDYRTGKEILEKTNSFKIRRGHILFIDECSMIDENLYELILEAFPDSKIVFVGDHAQMAPVGEESSVLYEHLEEQNTVVLTEPVRNSGQVALVNLCNQLRETVETGVFKTIQEVPGVIDYLDPIEMQAGLEHIFQDMNPSCRVLCYTNDQVNTYNAFIREDVRGLPAEPVPGDVFVVGKAFTRGKFTLSVEREVQVQWVGPIEENLAYTSELGETIRYREVALAAVGAPVPTIDDRPNPDYNLFVPMAVNPDQVTRLLRRAADQRNWGVYFDLKGDFADLRDKAACTVYKSQGSTYDSVFVDLGNIGTSYDARQVARMLFVAISRAKSRVFLYGHLPSRYYNSKGQPLWDCANTSPESSNDSSSQTESCSMSASVD